MSQPPSKLPDQPEADTDPPLSSTPSPRESSDPASGVNLTAEGPQEGAAPSQDTGDNGQNQAQSHPPPTPSASLTTMSEETVQDRMARRQANVEADLREKEAQMLTYVLQKFNVAYYRRWKAEANEMFNVAVIYRLRRHRRGKTPVNR